MGKKMGRNSNIVCFILLVISLMVVGCGTQQSPPPAAPPPAGTVQTSPTATPQPVVPPPAETPQAPPPTAPSVAATPPASPPPAGTDQTSPTAAPSQDYTQLRLGMTSDQAKKIMGEPGQIKPGNTVIRWFYSRPSGKVEVRIKNNQVIALELE
jgi:hypothetical protein